MYKIKEAKHDEQNAVTDDTANIAEDSDGNGFTAGDIGTDALMNAG